MTDTYLAIRQLICLCHSTMQRCPSKYRNSSISCSPCFKSKKGRFEVICRLVLLSKCCGGQRRNQKNGRD